MGNMSFLGIARILGVSDVAVMKWVRAEAQSLPEPEIPADVATVSLDEMWHFLEKKRKNAGSGEPLILSSGELWPGFWVGVIARVLGFLERMPLSDTYHVPPIAENVVSH
ncbi:MAG: hypothetical protein H6974_10220 [Gammaproteobacteria bacterium]|nr:hypothetical protein [Gammaproteobacteria bacterium]